MAANEEIVAEAEKLALQEIEKYDWPTPVFFEVSNIKGLELAKKLSADIFIVQIGTRLMDFKLGQALQEKRQNEHVKMSAEAAEEFLNRYKIDEKIKIKIINCIEAHHKEVPYMCKEAEIVANADCYRFLTARGFFSAVIGYAKMGLGFDDALNRIEGKVDEKAAIVSLDIVRKELDPFYLQIKKFIREARELS